MEQERAHPDHDDARWITPATAEEAVHVFVDVWSQGRPTAVGDARRMHSPPPDLTLISTERLNRILHVDRENGAIVLEAGTTIDDVRTTTSRVGLWCPALRWLPGRTSIGAAVTGGHGRRGRRYGSVPDYILGMRFICPEAGLVRHGGMTIKNATGYNLSAAVAGSRGTLGVVVEVILRLVPIPPARLVRRVDFASADEALAATRTLADVTLGVDALELASSLPDGTGQLLLEIEDAATTVAQRRLATLIERAASLGGWTDVETAWPPCSTEPDRSAARAAVEPRRLAAVGAQIVGAARDRGVKGWLLAEATGGAVELIGASESQASIVEIIRGTRASQAPGVAGHLHAALKAAFDPAGLLHAL